MSTPASSRHGSTITADDVLQAAHAVMRQYKRSWVRASDIYMVLISAAKTSTSYRNRQDLIRGERIYYILRTHGFVRDNTGSRCRRDPRYNYVGEDVSGDRDYMSVADKFHV